MKHIISVEEINEKFGNKILPQYPYALGVLEGKIEALIQALDMGIYKSLEDVKIAVKSTFEDVLEEK